jgi:phospholipid/cholesterol/gamma-HCH transport system substrate-binding protein
VITRQTRLQLLVFAIISVLGLTYTGARYADLDRYFVDEGYTISADFADSGGMFEGSEVTYRGVRIGEVTKLVLKGDGVVAQMLIENGTDVPTGARAVVANRSAVGEQYVDLQPSRSGAPFMKQGDQIPKGNPATCGKRAFDDEGTSYGCTMIPIQPTQLLVNLDDFVTSVDTGDVAVVLRELGTAFEGSGDDLQRLVDAGNLLTRAATDNLPATLQLIRDSKTALDTQRDVSEQFKSFNRDLAGLTQQIRDSDPDFRRLLANGATGSTELTELIETNRTDLPILLSNLVTIAQVQKVRLPALRQILVTYPNVAAGGFTVTPDDGTAHFGLVTSQAPGVCGTRDTNLNAPGKDGTGYNNSNRPYADVTAKTPDLTVYCSGAAAQNGSVVRGAGNAPRPGALAPFQGGTQGSTPRPPAGSATGTAIGDYDPGSGKAITPTGQRLTIGSSAGAARYLGSDSWQWLLLQPLSGP